MSTLLDAGFVVSLSPFTSHTIEKYADVILPIAAFSETSGTFVNCEGTWQSFAGIAAPLGEARPAWKVLRVLGNLLDLDGFDYVTSDEIRDECRTLTDGITPDNTRRGRYPQTGLSSADMVRLADVPLYAVDNLVRRATPLQLTRDARVQAAFINERQAAALQVAEGDQIHARQRHEMVKLPVVIDNRIPDGCVYIPSGIPGSEDLGLHGAPIELTAAN